ncbi:MAG: SIMPL domain-containing protein [Neisseria sp.]|nr:SIMPL domain-containing protein [Neisseria sp.]
MKKILLLPLLGTFSAVAAEPLNYNVVSFSEQANATVAHDLMTVTLVVREEGRDRRSVGNTLTRRLNTVQAKIAENRILRAELIGRNIQPRYEKGKIVRWNDTAYIKVKSKNFQALNKLVAEVQNEALLNNLYFSVSPEKRSETVNELSSQALKNFRTRADVVSSALGFSGYKIINININGNFNSNVSAKIMRASAPAAVTAYDAASEMTAEHPGSEEISQIVSGTVQMQ